ncbi:MAG TPA: ABC transporter ATP-binding protein [Acidimicrobiia bacterium]
MDAIVTEGLSKMYGKRQGLASLDMTVQVGEIYGFLGPNGAGKTTAIRIMLDVIRATSGRVRVLGLDPRADTVAVRRLVGYLPGDFVVDGRQTGRQLLDHLAALRGGVPRRRIEDLAGRLGLDLSILIKALSKGNRQKLGLVQSFMHRPDLLILDEPTAGLDPLVQREFQQMAREAIAEGQTVFMSSHVLSEVEAMVDRVGVIRDGRLVAVDRVEDLRQRSVRRIQVQFDAPVEPGDFSGVSGVEDLVIEGTTLSCTLAGRADGFVKALATHPVTSILSEEPDLDEIFLQLYSNGRSDR